VIPSESDLMFGTCPASTKSLLTSCFFSERHILSLLDPRSHAVLTLARPPSLSLTHAHPTSGHFSSQARCSARSFWKVCAPPPPAYLLFGRTPEFPTIAACCFSPTSCFRSFCSGLSPWRPADVRAKAVLDTLFFSGFSFAVLLNRPPP